MEVRFPQRRCDDRHPSPRSSRRRLGLSPFHGRASRRRGRAGRPRLLSPSRGRGRRPELLTARSSAKNRTQLRGGTPRRRCAVGVALEGHAPSWPPPGGPRSVVAAVGPGFGTRDARRATGDARDRVPPEGHAPSWPQLVRDSGRGTRDAGRETRDAGRETRDGGREGPRPSGGPRSVVAAARRATLCRGRSWFGIRDARRGTRDARRATGDARDRVPPILEQPRSRNRSPSESQRRAARLLVHPPAR